MTNQIGIYDHTSGEQIVREMNEDELTQWEADQTKAEAESQARAEAQTKRLALLDKLGITEEEARLLLGGN